MYFIGNVTGSDSLFTLADPDYDPTFVPLFFDDIDVLFGNNTALRAKAVALCGESKFSCLFDVALTADTQAAIDSRTSEGDYETEKKALSEYLHRGNAVQ